MRSVTTGTLYPGHGPPVPDGRKVIEKTLRHRAEREEQLVAALTRKPQSPRALVEAIYTDLPSAMHALAERSLLSGLVKLEEEGRLAGRIERASDILRACELCPRQCGVNRLKGEAQDAIKECLSYLGDNQKYIEGCEQNPFKVKVMVSAPIRLALKSVLQAVS